MVGPDNIDGFRRASLIGDISVDDSKNILNQIMMQKVLMMVVI